jgi:hypothetical protein
MNSNALEMAKSLMIIFIGGFVPLLIYDIIHNIIYVKDGKKFFVTQIILDIFFVLIFSILFILMIYYLSNGKFRGIYLFTMLLGCIAYACIFRKLVNGMISVVLMPIRATLRFILGSLKKMIIFFSNTIAKSRLKLYNKGVRNVV